MPREDKIHQAFKENLIKCGLVEEKDFYQYVTKNPDFILEKPACLGEVKRDTTSYKSAFAEIVKRKGKLLHCNNGYSTCFCLSELL